MKTLVFSKDSWHYKLISNLGLAYRGMNLCQYLRSLLGAFCICGIGLIGALGECVLVGSFLGWVAYILFNEWATPGPFAGITIVVLSIVAIAAAFWFILDALEDRKKAREIKEYEAKQDPNYKPKPDNFFVESYKSIKDKTCFKIEVE